jgi:hypothetical protein
VWHPVGPLRARVYWRRRLVVLGAILAVLAGGTWLTLALVAARAGDGAGTSPAASGSPVRTPALEQVVPSASSIATPTPPDATAAAAAASSAAKSAAARARPSAPAPVAGGPCTDAMISLVVRTDSTVAPGNKPTFEIVVGNISAVPCVRALDKNLREIVLQDGQGRRIWASNDCFPETSSEPRTLAPREAVALPVTWGGLTSEPTCTQPRTAPGPGSYFLIARLGTKVSAKTPVTLS